MRTGLQKLKTNIKNAVSTLPPESKAELYLQKRKHIVKLGMQGEQKKCLDAVKSCNEFYDENAKGNDYYSFHKADHKFKDWTIDYIHFQQFQQLLAVTDRERNIYKFDLHIMETLEYILTHHKELGSDFTINNALKLVSKVKEKTETTLKEYDETMPQIEQQVEDNEYFRKNNYFKDVDPLGYKDISWREFMTQMCNVGTNNGPMNIKGENEV